MSQHSTRLILDPGNAAWLHAKGHRNADSISTFINTMIDDARQDEQQITGFNEIIRAWINGDYRVFTRTADTFDEDAWSVFESFVAVLASFVISLWLPEDHTDTDLTDLAAKVLPPGDAKVLSLTHGIMTDVITGTVHGRPLFTSPATRARLMLIRRITNDDVSILSAVNEVLDNTDAS